MMDAEQAFDAVIVGGGPAGASSAALLAQKGRNVVVLEKDTFPRYHIGESMIPFCWYPLERIGMNEKLKDAGFIKKFSVQFVSQDAGASVPFYFSRHMDHPSAQTWQVERSSFDKMMLCHACQSGATIKKGVAAKEFITEAGVTKGVRARMPDGSMQDFLAPVTIDATGRDGLACSRNRWRIPDKKLKKVAVWSYYKGAKRDAGLDEGATTVAYVDDKNWFWWIPLQNDRVSVGVVGDKDYLFSDGRDLEQILDREIKKNVWIKDHVSTGKRVEPVQATGDYSYRSEYCAADGLVLTGDAFSFLDPVFSSGLFLALYSGVLAADAVDEALSVGDFGAARFTEYGEKFRGGLEAMRKLVYAFYDPNFSFGAVIKKHPHLRGDLTDCLIGNVEKDFDALFEAVSEFADIPEPVPHGSPHIAPAPA
jgi:flavin-dependent dehydrogenase